MSRFEGVPGPNEGRGGGQFEAGGEISGAVDGFSADPGEEDFGLCDVVRRDLHDVAVQDDQVCQFAGFEGAGLLVLTEFP